MVAAAVSVFADLIVNLASFVLEVCGHILIASIRSWRYLLSPTFRAEVDIQYAHEHKLIKLWHLLWGNLLLVASLAVLAGLVWFIAIRDPAPSTSTRQHIIERAEQTVKDKLRKHQEGKQ
ncbi:MAG: hypothetical protein V4582_24960 [Pseudomonadota bacterium]